MKANKELFEYLQEHLVYEYLMLKFTYEQLQKGTNTQLVWNGNFESFALHVRNITDFIDCTKDNRNYSACDYISKHQISSRDKNALDGILQDLNGQVFHLGKSRLRKEKIDMAKIKKSYEWCERNIQNFIGNLSDDFQNTWNTCLKREEESTVRISTGPTGPNSGISASSLPSSVHTVTFFNRED